MAQHELHETARAIVADHKGILAADESTGTIKKRFDSIGVESTEENRRFYRQLLFTAPGMEEYIGGVILYDETIRQATDDGTPFPEVLASKGSIPGIKVDTGAHDQALHPGEKITEGLDGLRGRLEEYRELGARFAKWRAVITIGADIPSSTCIAANAHALARYAAICQEAGNDFAGPHLAKAALLGNLGNGVSAFHDGQHAPLIGLEINLTASRSGVWDEPRDHRQGRHLLLDLRPGILAHDPFHDNHLIALGDRGCIEVDIVVKTEGARDEREERIGSFERWLVAQLRPDDFPVAKIEPAFDLLLPAPAL